MGRRRGPLTGLTNWQARAPMGAAPAAPPTGYWRCATVPNVTARPQQQRIEYVQVGQTDPGTDLGEVPRALPTGTNCYQRTGTTCGMSPRGSLGLGRRAPRLAPCHIPITGALYAPASPTRGAGRAGGGWFLSCSSRQLYRLSFSVGARVLDRRALHCTNTGAKRPAFMVGRCELHT